MEIERSNKLEKSKKQNKEESKINEIAGYGVSAKDKEGNQYKIGSQKFIGAISEIQGHQVYVAKNSKRL